jgi:hypothetical protein
LKTSRILHWLALAGLLLTAAAQRADAVQTRVIRDDSYRLLADGQLEGMTLTSDGYLEPGYRRIADGDSGAELVWDAVRDARGIVCATGHRGRLVRVLDNGTSRTLATLPEPELTAMLAMPGGSTLVAAAPGGRVYRLADDDTLTTCAQLNVSIVWRMALDGAGRVWAVTGPEGRLMRMTPGKDGSMEVAEAFAFRSANLLDLWIDEAGAMGVKGAIYVAGQNPGWLYRFLPEQNKAEVVYNASADEIRALLPQEQGLILALNTERAPSSNALNLTMRMAGGGRMSMNESRDGAEAPPSPGLSDRQLNEAFAPGKPQPNQGSPRSEIVRLERSGFARTLWTSPERPIHSLAASPNGRVLAAAGEQGRVFEAGADGAFSVVCDVKENYVVRLAPFAEGYLLTTARNGHVFSLGRERAETAVYLSRALDAGAQARWGEFYLKGELGQGSQATIAFRTGNDGDIDSDYWGAWSAERKIGVLDPVAAPETVARYLQYRLTLKQDAGAPPARLDYTEAYYQEPNGAPVVEQIVAVSGRPGPARSGEGAPSAPGAPAGGAPGGAPTPLDGPSTATDRDPHSNAMTLNLMWKASDPNGDQLLFELYYRAQDEQGWKLIDDEIAAPKMALSVAGVADGRYRFLAVATDKQSNPQGQGLRGEKISDEILIDNTPPRIENVSVKVQGHVATIRAEAIDELSLLSTFKADIDNGDTYPLLPADGLLDQPRESFEWRTEELTPGEHVATFAVTDRQGNTAVQKAVFTVDK